MKASSSWKQPYSQGTCLWRHKGPLQLLAGAGQHSVWYPPALKMSLSFAPLWHLEEIVLWFGVEKIINCLDRLQSSSSSPSLSSCKSSGNHFRRLFQKAIEGFECNSMASAETQQVWQSSTLCTVTNTGSFWVCSIYCWRSRLSLFKEYSGSQRHPLEFLIFEWLTSQTGLYVMDKVKEWSRCPEAEFHKVLDKNKHASSVAPALVIWVLSLSAYQAMKIDQPDQSESWSSKRSETHSNK